MKRYRWRATRWFNTVVYTLLLIVVVVNMVGTLFFGWVLSPTALFPAFGLAIFFLLSQIAEFWIKRSDYVTLRERAEAEAHGWVTRDQAVKVAEAAIREEITKRRPAP